MKKMMKIFLFYVGTFLLCPTPKAESVLQLDLVEAVRRGDQPALIRLLRAGADPQVQSECSPFGDTLLHWAVFWEKEAIVQTLLDEEVPIDIQNCLGGTSLHAAAAHNRASMVPLLHAYKANLEARDDEGGTPLHAAAFWGQEQGLQALLDAGASLDATDHEGQTPLHLAALHGHVGVVKLLIQARAPLNSQDKRGYTALHRALRLALGIENISLEISHPHRQGSRIAHELLKAGAGEHYADKYGHRARDYERLLPREFGDSE